MARALLICLLGMLLFLRDDSTCPDRSMREVGAFEPMPAVDAAPVELRPLEDYFPIVALRRSTFAVTYHSALGRGQGQTTSIMEAGFERQGNEYHRVTFESSGIPGLDKVVLYFRLAKEGVIQLRDDGATATESLLLPRKLAVGRSWEVDGGRVSARCRVLGLATVVCQGRRYEDCLRLRIDSDGLLGKGTEERWLAPGVGTVKQTYVGKWFSFESELAELPTDR